LKPFGYEEGTVYPLPLYGSYSPDVELLVDDTAVIEFSEVTS